MTFNGLVLLEESARMEGFNEWRQWMPTKSLTFLSWAYTAVLVCIRSDSQFALTNSIPTLHSFRVVFNKTLCSLAAPFVEFWKQTVLLQVVESFCRAQSTFLVLTFLLFVVKWFITIALIVVARSFVAKQRPALFTFRARVVVVLR